MFASIERSNNSSMGTKFHSSGEGRARNFVERVRKRNRRKSKMFLRHFARYSPLILPAKIFLAHFHNVILEGKKKKKRKSNVTPRIVTIFLISNLPPPLLPIPLLPSIALVPEDGGNLWKVRIFQKILGYVAMGSKLQCALANLYWTKRDSFVIFFSKYISLFIADSCII